MAAPVVDFACLAAWRPVVVQELFYGPVQRFGQQQGATVPEGVAEMFE